MEEGGGLPGVSDEGPEPAREASPHPGVGAGNPLAGLGRLGRAALAGIGSVGLTVPLTVLMVKVDLARTSNAGGSEYMRPHDAIVFLGVIYGLYACVVSGVLGSRLGYRMSESDPSLRQLALRVLGAAAAPPLSLLALVALLWAVESVLP